MRKIVGMLVVLAGLLSVVAAPALADMPGQWVSDSTGNPIPVPTQRYTVDHFFDLTTSVGFNRLDFTADVGHLLFNASLTTPAYSLTPVKWSSPLNWDNPIIPLAWYQNSIQHAQNGDVLGVSTSGNTEFYPISSFDTLIHGGPTATEVSVPIPLPLPPGVTFNLGPE